MVSATTSKGCPATSFRAACTTPGPETPTLMTRSGSPTPWKAPAIKGLSSTALQKTTSLEQPSPPPLAVRDASSLIAPPRLATASMLMPARVEPTLTEEQTYLVCASACGMARMRRSSACVVPFCTSAEKPPMKLTPQLSAARSSASAKGTYSSVLEAAATSAIGVTAIRLLTMGMPNSASMSSQRGTRFSAERQIFP